MFRKSLTLLALTLTLASDTTARASDNGVPPPCVFTRLVPQEYTVERIAYRFEFRTETFDTFRIEYCQENRERTVTDRVKVPFTRWILRKVPKEVTETQEQTVMRTVFKCVPETITKRRVVAQGHWETKTLACTETVTVGHACYPCTIVSQNTHFKVVKYWRVCPQYEDYQVTIERKVACRVPETIQVPVCRTVWCEEKCAVQDFRIEARPRVETYCVTVPRQVPCKATRTVRVAVPYTETVTCVRYVPQTICRTVVVVNHCVTAPCEPAAHFRRNVAVGYRDCVAHR